MTIQVLFRAIVVAAVLLGIGAITVSAEEGSGGAGVAEGKEYIRFGQYVEWSS